MRLEIHTFDPMLVPMIWGNESPEQGFEVRPLGTFVLRFDRVFKGRVAHFPRIIHFILVTGSRDDTEKAFRWLSERLKGKNIEKIVIEYRPSRFEPEEMSRIADEVLRNLDR